VLGFGVQQEVFLRNKLKLTYKTNLWFVKIKAVRIRHRKCLSNVPKLRFAKKHSALPPFKFGFRSWQRTPLSLNLDPFGLRLGSDIKDVCLDVLGTGIKQEVSL
jgi:hypothetical protein